MKTLFIRDRQMRRLVTFIRKEFIGKPSFSRNRVGRSKLSRERMNTMEYWVRLSVGAVVGIFFNTPGATGGRGAHATRAGKEIFRGKFNLSRCDTYIMMHRPDVIFSCGCALGDLREPGYAGTQRQVGVIKIKKYNARARSFVGSRLRALSLTARTMKHAAACNKHFWNWLFS